MSSTVSNVIPSLYERDIFSSGKSDLWTARMYIPSRWREKKRIWHMSAIHINNFDISEDFHENVGNVRKY